MCLRSGGGRQAGGSTRAVQPAEARTRLHPAAPALGGSARHAPALLQRATHTRPAGPGRCNPTPTQRCSKRHEQLPTAHGAASRPASQPGLTGECHAIHHQQRRGAGHQPRHKSDRQVLEHIALHPLPKQRVACAAGGARGVQHRAVGVRKRKREGRWVWRRSRSQAAAAARVCRRRQAAVPLPGPFPPCPLAPARVLTADGHSCIECGAERQAQRQHPQHAARAGVPQRVLDGQQVELAGEGQSAHCGRGARAGVPGQRG